MQIPLIMLLLKIILLRLYNSYIQTNEGAGNSKFLVDLQVKALKKVEADFIAARGCGAL